MDATRRDFLLRTGCGLSFGAVLASLDRLHAVSAATAPLAASDYRALVCVFLYGGNDGNNLVIPYDDYAAYGAVRGTSLNIPQANLLQVTAPSHGQTFGLHPSLAELQPVYQAGRMAVVCNVGPLVEPITRAEYQSGAPRPENLFSHSDQQGQQQSAVPSSTSAVPTGWGGRTADATAGLNAGTFPMIISVSGLPLFATGVNARPLVPSAGLRGFTSSTTSQARLSALRRILTLDAGLTLVGAANDGLSTAIDDTGTLNAALASAPALATVFPATSLGNQMKTIAQVISARGALGVQRQIFFASLGGFDTHTNQLATQASLLTQVSQALRAFYDATGEMGVAGGVTTFTLSDFGRTFKPAAGGGADHAWGNHHLVLGGSVRGGDFFGTYPTLALQGPDDTSSEGRWIPTTAVDQYAATLARWYGLAPADVPAVFPNIGNFDGSDLGFLV